MIPMFLFSRGELKSPILYEDVVYQSRICWGVSRGKLNPGCRMGKKHICKSSSGLKPRACTMLSWCSYRKSRISSSDRFFAFLVLMLGYPSISLIFTFVSMERYLNT